MEPQRVKSSIINKGVLYNQLIRKIDWPLF